MKITGLTICLLSAILTEKGGDAQDLKNVESHQDPLLKEAEKKAGDPADNFGVNRHKYVPNKFLDFGRRFVPQYPYREMQSAKHVELVNNAEESLDKAFEEIKKNNIEQDEKLIPKRVAPEILIKVAEESLKRPEAPKPYNDKGIQKDMLRNGEYWDNFWVEDINPDTVRAGPVNLRSEPKDDKLNMLRLKVMPGSRLHEIVSVAKQLSPRLLYIINTNKNNQR